MLDLDAEALEKGDALPLLFVSIFSIYALSALYVAFLVVCRMNQPSADFWWSSNLFTREASASAAPETATSTYNKRWVFIGVALLLGIVVLVLLGEYNGIAARTERIEDLKACATDETSDCVECLRINENHVAADETVMEYGSTIPSGGVQGAALYTQQTIGGVTAPEYCKFHWEERAKDTGMAYTREQQIRALETDNAEMTAMLAVSGVLFFVLFLPIFDWVLNKTAFGSSLKAQVLSSNAPPTLEGEVQSPGNEGNPG